MNKNINNYNSQPCMFLGLKSGFALCQEDGTILQIFTELSSAKYMINSYSHGCKVYEVALNKQNIYSNLGEIKC